MTNRGWIADIILKTVLVKLKALEEVGVGILSKDDVSVATRMAIIFGSINEKYQERVADVKESREDIESVLRVAKELDLELTPEEISVLGKIRRFTIEKMEVEGVREALRKVLDVDREKVGLQLTKKV